MLHSVKELEGYDIFAADGHAGKVYEFYFSDSDWFIQYLIADIGHWLYGRFVLLEPQDLLQPDPEEKIFPVILTKEQIQNSPDISTKKIKVHRNSYLVNEYGWPNFFETSEEFYSDVISDSEISKDGVQRHAEEHYDPHLRSTWEMTGFRLHASDGEIGHVEDLLFDDSNWKVRYLCVNLRNWLPGGKKILIPVLLISKVDADQQSICIEVPREKIRLSPEFNPSRLKDVKYREDLMKYYTT
ncbi:MAG: PRC-barrel domain containing protein [Ignavibacteria bacterium]|jgi:sporulation protein YlmC with PRC-barrel domain|nr:PRC-barrel domain containing protein [Ignavibacteria bacterium]MCU7501944.1 PRC-barrel domain containing protein [Ignavibacteria bacterium]MCU7516912.1 PRC-barrel domain containing protein [Ignavibacteria bacterium]